MIKKLNHRNEDMGREIRALFQASYRVEAEMLNAANFPPLKRPLEDFLNSKSTFYGLLKDDEIAAIVEVTSIDQHTDIESLVVHPMYFRQGLGRQLVLFLFDSFDSTTFAVETGLANLPATKLYTNLGFKEVKQWDTDFGIRKVQFVKTAHEDL